MSKKKENYSEIKFKVGLDENNVPADIKWKASDSEHEELKDCKAFMITLWDAVEQNTFSINLWTKDMSVTEMHKHYLRSLEIITQTYEQATGNPFAREEIKNVIEKLYKKTEDWEVKRHSEKVK